MLGYFCWFVVVTVFAGALAAIGSAIETSWTEGWLASVRRRLIGFAVCVVILALLAVIYRVHAVARADSSVVAHLAGAHGSHLNSLMSYLTLTGDTVPSFLIAAGLAVVIFRQGKHKVGCWILPVLVLAELIIQFAMGKIFHDVTIADFRPTLVDGGVGQIPSGSVARLLSVFLIAAFLCRSHDVVLAKRVGTLGLALVTMQLVSRLELARHLLADIAAGIALGAALALAASLVFSLADDLQTRRGVWSPRGSARRAAGSSDPEEGREATSDMTWPTFGPHSLSRKGDRSSAKGQS